jgi:hypothetical protein
VFLFWFDSGVSANTWQVTNTTSIRAKDGEGCPRCGGAVFAAEQMLAKGRPWHKGCFKCKACSKYLDSTTHCDGPDRDIYCRGMLSPWPAFCSFITRSISEGSNLLLDWTVFPINEQIDHHHLFRDWYIDRHGIDIIRNHCKWSWVDSCRKRQF